MPFARQRLERWKEYICWKLKCNENRIDSLLESDDTDCILDFIEELCRSGQFDVVDLLCDPSKC